MIRPPIRRLTLADLAILIAASAGALLLLRMALEAEVSNPWTTGLRRDHLFYGRAASFLLPAAAALIVARSIGPRPRLRRALWQPGTIACASFLLSFVLNVSLLLGKGMLMNSLLSPPRSLPMFDIHFILLNCAYVGETVAASWVTLAISKRWRPEPSWIDRSGRVFGVVLILMTIAIRLAP